MLSLGIDAIEIARFSQWHGFTPKKLGRIFTQMEIDYCLSNPKKSAERFAVRFAAKEALYKAITPLCSQPLSFLYVCSNAEIKKSSWGAASFYVQWEKLTLSADYQANISLTHTTTTAFACVIIVHSLTTSY